MEQADPEHKGKLTFEDFVRIMAQFVNMENE